MPEDTPLPKGIYTILLEAMPPQFGLILEGTQRPDMNEPKRNLAAAKLINLFNGEMIEFLRMIRSVEHLSPEDFKASIMSSVEKAEEVIAELNVEL